MKFTLTRRPTTDQGTFGDLESEDGNLLLRTLELPWRDGASKISCIPPGVYLADPFNSPSKGAVYLLKNVTGRSMIEIHSANFAGDTAKGWQSQLLGCIALGLGYGDMTNEDGKWQKCVLNSKPALKRFLDFTAGREIELTIVNGAPA
jgi:hypothetical protein